MEGRWITIGGQKGEGGKRHGGSPVFIEGGRITKGAPKLVGRKIDALREEGDRTHRQELHQQKAYSRAIAAKKARAAGVNPQHLHQLAAEVLAHDKEHVEGRKRLLKDTRDLLTKYGYHAGALTTNLRSGHVEDNIPGMDLVSRTMANRYPEQFAGGKDELDNQQRLIDLLTEGNPEVLSEEDAYEQALEQLQQYREDDDVPFSLADGIDDADACSLAVDGLQRMMERERRALAPDPPDSGGVPGLGEARQVGKDLRGGAMADGNQGDRRAAPTMRRAPTSMVRAPMMMQRAPSMLRRPMQIPELLTMILRGDQI